MRIKPHDFCMSDSMPFQQHWEARITVPIEGKIDADVFMDLRYMLKAGDHITVCFFEKERLKQFVSIRVVQVKGDDVEIFQIGEIVDIPAEKIDVADGEADLYVKRGFGGVFQAIDASGNVVEEFSTKHEAEKYAGVG